MNNEKSPTFTFVIGILLALLQTLFLILGLVNYSSFFSSDGLESGLAILSLAGPLIMFAVLSFFFWFATDKKLDSQAGKKLRLIIISLSLVSILPIVVFLLIQVFRAGSGSI